MSFTTHQCPVCKGEKSTMAFVCGEIGGGVQALDCKTCDGKGYLTDPELQVHDERDAKRKQRRAARLAKDLSMREMAKLLGVSVLKYNDYEHGRIDL